MQLLENDANVSERFGKFGQPGFKSNPTFNASLVFGEQNVNSKQQKIHESKEIVCLRTFCQAIIMVLDTYDSVLISQARGGVALFAARLISITCSDSYQKSYHKAHCESNLINGLDIFRMCTTPVDARHISYLLNDE